MDATFCEWVLFWTLAVGAVGFALLVVAGRSPVSSALSLACSMVFGAGLMVQLRAYFIAAVQVLVYAGAVIVLFLFIIMLMDLRAGVGRRRGALGLLAGAVVCVSMAVAGWRALAPLAGGGGPPPAAPDEVRQFGRLLFAENVLPLEVTGVLLLVVMVGVVVLCRPGGADGERGRP